MFTHVSPSSFVPGYMPGPPMRTVNCKRRQLFKRATLSWFAVPTTAKYGDS
ncbi:MAG TPA: hypothetical protein VH374_24520 [Polyangia bacterium]|nr:hypothetical protein [Polyangia bacterium]